MKTTTTHADLARLARQYADRAQPVAGETEDETNETEVDVRIDVDLHEKVRIVADYNGHQLTDVARALLFTAASKVTVAQVERYRDARELRAAEATARAVKRAKSRGAEPAEIEQAGQRARDRVMRQRLPLRTYRHNRYRLRFTVPSDAYGLARDAIQASGRSVAVAVEEGLYEYAKTEGRIA